MACDPAVGETARPSVVSWNLTRLCNEACAHCYLDAGREADRSDELTTAECLNVLAQLQELAPGALLIFTGGEPLLRADILRLSRAAAEAGFTAVVGTNGLRLTPERAAQLQAAGVRGVALSLDSLHAEIHDAFRGRQGAWKATVASIETLRAARLPFVLQTTVTDANLAELAELVSFAAEKGAWAHKLYFLVPSGRGKSFTSNISPEAYEALLEDIRRWQEQYEGRLILGAQCAPHYQRVLWQHDHNSPYLRSYASKAGTCPAAIHYLGLRPNGDMTPCPYLPVYGGNVRRQSLADIWWRSPLFKSLRARAGMAGRCGSCEFWQVCGGCRARAYAATGDVLGEDPLCAYEPGQAAAGEVLPDSAAMLYGLADHPGIPWTPEAERLLAAVPLVLRGHLRQSIERRARQQGAPAITLELMRQFRPPPFAGTRFGGSHEPKVALPFSK